MPISLGRHTNIDIPEEMIEKTINLWIIEFPQSHQQLEKWIFLTLTVNLDQFRASVQVKISDFQLSYETKELSTIDHAWTKSN